MKYYEPEHVNGYARLKAEGKSAWGQLHGEATFEDSEIRGVLARVLPRLSLTSPNPKVLEYGCGTGPGACFLAERGMRVCGVDLSPIAIEIAGREASRRGLAIYFTVADACTVEPPRGWFDLVVDSYCLQCIVTDADRQKIFALARRVLKSDGYYVVATAGYSPRRNYRGCRYDPATGVVLERRWFRSAVPCRRHVTADALAREVAAADFTVEWHETADDGDIVLIARPT